MSSTNPVRVRFAPSPTGMLHIGGVRTALFNFLFARANGGKFILRLEDTDRERFVASGVDQITEVLRWLGLTPDEGYWLGEHKGQVGPYIQSERLPHYQDYAQQLVEKSLAYYSLITPEEFTALKNQAISEKRAFVYRQTMEPKRQPEAGKQYPIRLKIGAGQVSWQDEIRGEFTVENSIIDDFVIIKADGFPTYNFANVIDDHLMKISHVIRGDEFISSTPKHAMLYDLLGFDRPSWIHLPLILGTDGSKLSKRNGDTDALGYRESGYLPEAIINFLALLGWNDGSEQEIFDLEELIKVFDIKRIQKSPAIFDIDRLDWLNGRYIREILSPDRYAELAWESLQQAQLINPDFDQEYVKKVVFLERERLKKFSELPDLVDFFFTAPMADASMKQLLLAKSSGETVKTALNQSYLALEHCPDDVKQIEAALRDVAKQANLSTGDVFYPIRIALTGKTAAPGLFETIATLGIEQSRQRIANAQLLIN